MYRIVVYPEVADQIAALPDEALDAYAEVLGVLELTPWKGPPLHEDNPDGAVRRWDLGAGHAGQAIYLILDEQQEVSRRARPVVRLTLVSCVDGGSANRTAHLGVISRAMSSRVPGSLYCRWRSIAATRHRGSRG